MANKKQLIFSFLLPILVTVIMPSILLICIEKRTILNLINASLGFLILGNIIIGLGIVLFIECNFLFYRIGKGTLMGLPKMQTAKLIIVGPFKYVRNPMYLSVIAIVIGESFVFGAWSVLIWVFIFWLMFIIYLAVSEEKGLVKRFGDEYIRYKQNVRGWIPRLTSYNSDKNTEN